MTKENRNCLASRRLGRNSSALSGAARPVAGHFL